MGKQAPTPAQRQYIWEKTGVKLACFREKETYEPYEPFALAHNSPASVVLTSGANRVGKSVAAAMEAIAWVPFSDLIWFMGPSYSHTRKEFEYFAEGMSAAGLVVDLSLPSREHMACSLLLAGGCYVQTRTLRDIVRALQSDSPDLIVFCEAGLMNESPLDRMRVRMATSRGRIWASGTMEEAADWLRLAYDRWQEFPNEELAQSFNIPLWYNTHDFPGGAENTEIALLRRNLNRNLFIEKIEGRPAPSALLVFGYAFNMGNVPFFARDCPFESITPEGEAWPVEIAIDPGYNPSHYSVTALQRHGDDVWAIDEIAVQGETHEAVIRMCQDRVWWPNVIGGTIDPWPARSHGVGYEASPLDIWTRETGLSLRAEIRPTPQAIVERWRYYLVHPTTGACHFFFDRKRCSHLLYELNHWLYHKDIQGRPLKTEPQKRNCDSIKGIGCWLVDDFSTKSWRRNFAAAKPRVSTWTMR